MQIVSWIAGRIMDGLCDNNFLYQCCTSIGVYRRIRTKVSSYCREASGLERYTEVTTKLEVTR